MDTAYRKDDPDTSAMAAKGMKDSGLADSHRDACLRAVHKNPGSTAAEIAQLAELERHEASRRLPELRERQLVMNGLPRRCTAQGTMAITWWPCT